MGQADCPIVLQRMGCAIDSLTSPLYLFLALGTLAFFCIFPQTGNSHPSKAPEASPHTYYVDSIAGDDANSGTAPPQAWKTISKVNATTFSPGDSILLKAGCSWAGQLWPKGSGSEALPIRIGKYGDGALPQIKGDGLVEDAVLLKNQEYWEIAELDVSNFAESRAIRRGVHLALENFGEAHHIIVRGLTIHDISGRDDSKKNGGIIFSSAGDKKPSRFIGLLIENNELYHTDRNGISSESDRWQRTLWYPSLRVVIRNNKLHDIGGDGIMIAATDGALLEHNVVGHANQRSEGYNVAIWTWSADNSIIQFNEAYGTKGQRDGEGFDSDWNSRNTLIQYNYSHDNDGGFLLICDDGGQSHSDSIGNIGTIVRYNISQNDRHRGITVSGHATDTLVYNNTIYIGVNQKSDIVLLTDWYGWPETTSFFNNIFYALGEAKIGHAISRDKVTGEHTSAPGFGESKETYFDANVYFGKIIAPPDKHALTQDPEFSAAEKSGSGRESLADYALIPKSPASGRTILANGGRDFLGTSLAGCKSVDRGAIQSAKCAAP